MKQRLLQEHVEELSRLKRPPACDGGALAGGAAASLRTQLKAKDLELRQVQSSMAQWEGRTAARLAGEFEEELTAELERYRSKKQNQVKIKVFEWKEVISRPLGTVNQVWGCTAQSPPESMCP